MRGRSVVVRVVLFEADSYFPNPLRNLFADLPGSPEWTREARRGFLVRTRKPRSSGLQARS